MFIFKNIFDNIVYTQSCHIMSDASYTEVNTNTTDVVNNATEGVIYTKKYFKYDLRFIIHNNHEMYIVNDILKQYSANEKKPKKNFIRFLELPTTQELIDVMCSTGVTPNSEEPLYKQKDDVLMKYNFSNITSTINEAYVVCEHLLLHCLTWVNPSFSFKIYSFLIRCRSIDNEFLNNDLTGLIYSNKYNSSMIVKLLSARYIKDVTQNNWKLDIRPMVNTKSKCIDLCIVYRKSNNSCLSKNSLITVTKIPNANVLRSILFPMLLEMLGDKDCKRKNKQRSHISIPLSAYTTQEFIASNNSVAELLLTYDSNPTDIEINTTLYDHLKQIISSVITALQWNECEIKYLY